MASQSVFVSGATGYIAQFIVKKLLAKGYNVVGSVRSVEKGENLLKLLGSDNFSYEVVEAIEGKGAFDEAIKKHPEVTIFLHTASPFHYNATDIDRDLLTPAVDGTINAFSAIKEFGPQIKKVVLTSSYAALKNTERDLDPTFTVDETSWNPITREEALKNSRNGYVGSKKLAEKAAWDFLEKERPNFTLSAVNPVFVLGPQAFDENVKDTLNTSAEAVNSFLKLKETDEIPNFSGGYIDVRDVADAHIVAFENPEATGVRLFLTAGRFDSQLIADIIHKNFPEYAKNLPIGKPGSSSFENLCVWDNLLTKKILGFEFIDLEKTIVDSVQQILNAQKSQ